MDKSYFQLQLFDDTRFLNPPALERPIKPSMEGLYESFTHRPLYERMTRKLWAL